MTSKTNPDIPDPDNPGGTGAQVVGPVTNSAALAMEPLAGLMNAVNGIVESQPKALGGNVAAMLMQGAVSSYQSELKNARIALDKLQTKNDKLVEDLALERQRTATLTTEIGGFSKQTTFSNLCMTIATVLAGLAVDAFKSEAGRFAYFAATIALVLVIGAWIIPRFKWTKK